jgi:hypothetical protein
MILHWIPNLLKIVKRFYKTVLNLRLLSKGKDFYQKYKINYKHILLLLKKPLLLHSDFKEKS